MLSLCFTFNYVLYQLHSNILAIIENYVPMMYQCTKLVFKLYLLKNKQIFIVKMQFYDLSQKIA